ncbi:MAG: SDR family NAD(P)-dependent oxidoreductase [Candidatus Thiodiazotropha taylori]
MDIENKVVVVTGASSGIGAAIAKAMVRSGANKIALLARSEERLQKVAAECEADGARVFVYPVDLSDSTAALRAIQSVLEEAGVPDILINNAGSGRWRFLQEIPQDEIVEMMALPYFAAAWMAQGFLPGMLTRGSGHILNISSVASRMAWPGATAYIAASRAMRGLSDALRADLHRTKINVTHYESGPIQTPYWINNPDSRERVPGIARLLIPALSEDQVAHAVVTGIRRNKRFIVIPGMLKVVYLLYSAFPWLVQWLMTRTGHQSSVTAKTLTD